MVVVDYVDADEIRIKYKITLKEKWYSFRGDIKSYPLTNSEERIKELWLT